MSRYFEVYEHYRRHYPQGGQTTKSYHESLLSAYLYVRDRNYGPYRPEHETEIFDPDGNLVALYHGNNRPSTNQVAEAAFHHRSR